MERVGINEVSFTLPSLPLMVNMKSIWSNMKNRCLNPNADQYKWYGGRGITICAEWLSYQRFALDIVNTIGNRPSLKHTLDRIDNDQGYKISNVRWATQSQQLRNSSATHLVEIDGITQCVTAWAEQYGLAASTIYKRLNLGWSGRRLLCLTGSSRNIQGQLNASARLSNADVLAIRKRLTAGEKGRTIARDYNRNRDNN